LVIVVFKKQHKKFNNQYTMRSQIGEQVVILKWLSDKPTGANKIALLIPQFNEGKHSYSYFKRRLNYFMMLCSAFNHIIDVIIIDDGSTDDSVSMISDFLTANPNAFYASAVTPNMQKIGALNVVSSVIKHDYVILSDFDTDLRNLERLPELLDSIDLDPKIMGCYFKMIPHEGAGIPFLLQQLEYSFARMYYKFHNSEQSVPVMPGAGSCFKREHLLKVYSLHSGLRNGEDREATVIGLNLGYKTVYINDVLALTRPPLTGKALLIQRKRWYLGYLQTFLKEKVFYSRMIEQFSRIGIRTLQDAIGICILLLLPLEILVLSVLSVKVTGILLLATYALSLIYYFSMFISSPDERTEIEGRNVWLISLFPLFWLSISFVAWWKAFLSIRKVGYRRTAEARILMEVPEVYSAMEYVPENK
jgi:cellulose synthase/poly-beta-1,6-N-acetylglucosamine synthase-like glycosyltransferase